MAEDSEVYILPDLLDKKADKHPSVTYYKKKILWEWLEKPKHLRQPTTRRDCYIRLGITPQTGVRWEKEWVTLKNERMLPEIKTTPEEITAILQRKIETLHISIDNTKKENASIDEQKSELIKVAEFALWFALTKGSSKLIQAIEKEEGAEGLTNALEKVIRILQKMGEIGYGVMAREGSIVKEKKTISISQKQYLQGCNLPSIGQPKVIDVKSEEVVSDGGQESKSGEDNEEDL